MKPIEIGLIGAGLAATVVGGAWLVTSHEKPRLKNTSFAHVQHSHAPSLPQTPPPPPAVRAGIRPEDEWAHQANQGLKVADKGLDVVGRLLPSYLTFDF